MAATERGAWASRRKEPRTMNTRMQPISTDAVPARRLRPLLGGLGLLLLAWSSAAPASARLDVDGTNSSEAQPYTINSSVDGPIYVTQNGWLKIGNGAQISGEIGLVVIGG